MANPMLRRPLACALNGQIASLEAVYRWARPEMLDRGPVFAEGNSIYLDQEGLASIDRLHQPLPRGCLPCGGHEDG